MNQLLAGYGITVVAVLLFMTLVFSFALRQKRFDGVDIAWGLVFIVAASTSFIWGALESNVSLVNVALLAMVMAWGLRLALHIGKRYLASKEEDRRYQEIRSRWRGNVALNAYVKIFLLQGILAIIVVSPVILVNITTPESYNVAFFVTGLLLWITGFLFEAVADRQLKTFIKNPKNKGSLMTSGLWKYSRHPNYFGEIVQWWAVWLVALSATASAAFTIIGPILITVLLVWISGVPLLEKKYAGRKDWQAYAQKTSKLFPLPPKQ